MSNREETVGDFRYTRYEPRLPPLEGGAEQRRWPVAIMGGGPVGLALALGLAGRGVPTVVLEADDCVCIGSRAACISRRSLEIVDRLGVLPAFLAKGLAWTGGRSFYKTKEVFRFEMPHDEHQRLPPMINLQQYYIEQYLVDAIERGNRSASAGGPAAVDLRWASEVTSFRMQEDAVAIDVRTPLGAYTTTADWLVACDGGQSLGRRLLGLPLVGTAYEGRYVIIDIHLPSSHPTERRAWFDPPWNPGSTVLMPRQVDDIWRIDYQLRAGEDTETALQPENVTRFVQRHLDSIGEGHLPWRTIWTSVYRAGALTLESYRHGRLFFAGNAAHAMPIFGVRGLNSGFDDADNLAWKLALVLQGKAEEALLDSYSQERIGAFRINAESAMRSTEFMSPPSRGFDLLREAALSLAARHRDIAQLINPRQTEAVSYLDSPLSTADRLDDGIAPGRLLPDFPLQPDGHLTERLGAGFALLVLAADKPDPRLALAADEAAQRLGLPLQRLLVTPPGPDRTRRLRDGWERACAAAHVFASHAPQGDITYLLRPDRHVAARWLPGGGNAPDVAAALSRACGMGQYQPTEIAT